LYVSQQRAVRPDCIIVKILSVQIRLNVSYRVPIGMEIFKYRSAVP